MSSRTVYCTAGIAALCFVPAAMADVVQLGSVDLGSHGVHERAYSRFGGPVEELRLTAMNSDVDCRSIRVKYENGKTDQVFSGRLRRDHPISVDVRGEARRIDSVRFTCHSLSWRGASISVGAEVGQFRSAWEKSKDWISHWANLFGRNRNRERGWERIGREEFSRAQNYQASYPKWNMRQVELIALRPIDNDARCTRISAAFENGNTRPFDIDRRDVIEHGEMTVLDVPRGGRNLRRVDLHCRALGNDHVTIEILARR